jgi:hypothetical protein
MRMNAMKHVTALPIASRTNFRGDLAGVSGRRGCGMTVANLLDRRQVNGSKGSLKR